MSSLSLSVAGGSGTFQRFCRPGHDTESIPQLAMLLEGVALLVADYDLHMMTCHSESHALASSRVSDMRLTGHSESVVLSL
jgi:hypothetical protein